PMKFEENQIYHIYNQGNNQRQVFFEEANYLFFLWKMRAYLHPFGDFISWCLMPNHFHWQFFVKKVVVPRHLLWKNIDSVEYQRRLKQYGKKAKPVDNHFKRKADRNELVDLNQAIGTLEQSYTSAINKQKKWSGSLFRKGCHAKDGFIPEFLTLMKHGREDPRFQLGNDYGFTCFQYIHQNAVAANLAVTITSYQWSSARDYAGLRRGTMCNLDRGRAILDFLPQ
ncbi:MAG: hypothetical protein AAGJ18_29540, partial [Bacteroidota bacterium]